MPKHDLHKREIPRLAGLTRRFGPDDPRTLAARSDLAYSVIRQHIDERRAQLSPEHRAALAASLA